MKLRLSVFWLSAGLVVLAAPAMTGPVSVPLLTAQELRCQKATFTAATNYLQAVFNARQACFDKVTRRELPTSVNCRARVDTGTGNDPTDDAITAAEAALSVEIQLKCQGIDLKNLGFPGLCEDFFGPPYDSFDHEQCLIERGNSVIDRLLAIEHPPFPGVVGAEDFVCQDVLATKASNMFYKEVDARTSCENRRFNSAIPQEVNCRAEIDPLEPATGDNATDADVVSAHVDVLRGIANACEAANLGVLGFPHRCTNGEGLFSVAALTECMYKTHHFELISFIDTLVPLTKLCGNCLLDGETGESCDDGDNEWVKGEICRLNCSVVLLCGDPDDSGAVTIRDSLFILRAAVGLEACHASLCDVNGDNFINTTDALLALRAVVGLPVAFACNPPNDLVCAAP